MTGGVIYHGTVRKIFPNSSPFDFEAIKAGIEGVEDGRKRKNWKNECEKDMC